MENDIRGIEEAIRAKTNPMKLAQTRLENRTYRPNVELCRDAPQYGLTDEVKQLEATKRALEEKLKQAKYVTFCSMLSCLHIDPDLKSINLPQMDSCVFELYYQP